jgi:FkbM family methyltransferase
MNTPAKSDDFACLEKRIPEMGFVGVVIDVGCWLMNETRAMRERWPLATIICFEPDPRSVGALLADGTPAALNAQLFPMAVGHKIGTVQLWKSTNLRNGDPENQFWQASSIRKPVNFGEPSSLVGNPCIFERDPVGVSMVPLDAFIPLTHLQTIDLLWIDAQGAEDAILMGAQGMLKRTRWIFGEHNTGGLYEGAPDIEALKALLPDWEILEVLPYNFVARNKAFP